MFSTSGGSQLHRPLSCSLRTTISFTTSLASRLLLIAIALYRWVYVRRSAFVLTSTQKGKFFLALSSTITVLIVGLTTGAFYYKETYTSYHNCWNEHSMNTIIKWDLPITNLFLLLTFGCFLGNLFLSPLLYVLIYRFRRSNGQNLGLNTQRGGEETW